MVESVKPYSMFRKSKKSDEEHEDIERLRSRRAAIASMAKHKERFVYRLADIRWDKKNDDR